jgi:RNA polymerase sigma factor (sigma-70 family)
MIELRPHTGGSLVQPMDPLTGLDVRRLLPSENPDEQDRALAWQTCWEMIGDAVLKYIRYKNRTSTDDTDILADSMAIAYVEVERGRYQHRSGVPFTAYVKGIARNMILEAARRDRRSLPLDDFHDKHAQHDLEAVVEHSEQQEALHRHMLELSPRRREVLLLYGEGHDTAHIANNLGIREDLVRQEKSRGIQQLKRKLVG